ncbi:MAG TPA: hypothetical protein VIC55_05215 [Gemmatimonadaceae bacterium]
MTDPGSRGAAAALEAVRPAVERLDPTRHSEANAADLAEIWAAVETSLRALLGGSPLSGQPLVREVRQRELITLEHAHAVLELLAVHERVQRADYQPVSSDLEVAREAYGVLGAGFVLPNAMAALSATASMPAVASLGESPPPPAVGVPLAARPVAPNRWQGIVLVVLAIVLAGGGYYWYRGGGRRSALEKGIAAYAASQRDSARVDFARAVHDDPRASAPHVYLARLAREDGDFATAGRELKAAIELEPGSARAQAELGAFFLARGTRFTGQHRPDLAAEDYDAARRAYIRAVQIEPSDTASQGYLGCALARLGRAADAAIWLGRAGAGPWSACAASAAPAPAP